MVLKHSPSVSDIGKDLRVISKGAEKKKSNLDSVTDVVRL